MVPGDQLGPGCSGVTALQGNGESDGAEHRVPWPSREVTASTGLSGGTQAASLLELGQRLKMPPGASAGGATVSPVGTRPFSGRQTQAVAPTCSISRRSLASQCHFHGTKRRELGLHIGIHPVPVRLPSGQPPTVPGCVHSTRQRLTALCWTSGSCLSIMLFSRDSRLGVTCREEG